MKKSHTTLLTVSVFAIAAILTFADSASAQSSPYRGLWVGSVSLRAVNEVAVSKDAEGIDRAPVAEVPTATFDEANLRLILHVNGAGQVSLLKDVAILNRVEHADESGAFATETDLALVTDPELYTEFPLQPAQRIASASFEFGDAEATKAVDALVDEAVRLATDFVMALDRDVDLASEGLRVQAQENATDSIVASNETIAANADVAEAFNQFMMVFKDTEVDLVAVADANAALVASNYLEQAVILRDQSFYADERGIDMVNAVVAAVNDANALSASLAERKAIAQNTAATYADVGNLYQRFISGKGFGDMIVAVAQAAGDEARLPGATEATIAAALRSTPEAIAVLFDADTANIAKVGTYSDTRALDAVNHVLAAMAASAFTNRALLSSEIEDAGERAGRNALSDMVARYPLPLQTPTRDYNAWVQSADYAGAAQIAAAAAAQGAVKNRHESSLSNADSVAGAARDAAISALSAEYAKASRAGRTELPMTGVFGPGSGDPRVVSELALPSDLGPAGLEATIILPALHPTNPFLHFRHPDHRRGFDIERRIRLDFDAASGSGLESASFGVDRVAGAYREEIFGLHKPLGSQPEINPIGLKTEGRFLLNRISYIDTLNTR